MIRRNNRLHAPVLLILQLNHLCLSIRILLAIGFPFLLTIPHPLAPCFLPALLFTFSIRISSPWNRSVPAVAKAAIGIASVRLGAEAVRFVRIIFSFLEFVLGQKWLLL